MEDSIFEENDLSTVPLGPEYRIFAIARLLWLGIMIKFWYVDMFHLIQNLGPRDKLFIFILVGLSFIIFLSVIYNFRQMIFEFKRAGMAKQFKLFQIVTIIINLIFLFSTLGKLQFNKHELVTTSMGFTAVVLIFILLLLVMVDAWYILLRSSEKRMMK